MPNPSSHEPNLSTHPLVTKLQGDSDTPPNLVALTGYFGPSKKADSNRLYPSLDFQSYFEIPKAAIIATTPVDSKDDQSPTVVHVKAGTPVEAVQTSTQPVESYLQGGITGAYYPLDNSEPLPWAVLHTGVFTVCACPHPQAAAQAAVVGPITLGYYCYYDTYSCSQACPYTRVLCRPYPQAAAQAAVPAGNTLLRPCVPNTFVCTRICPTNPPHFLC